MTKVTMLAAFALVCAVAAESSAGPLKINIHHGSVTLVADDALATDVLAAWGHRGKTQIVGAELLADRRVSLMLDRVPELDAMSAILGEGFQFITEARERVIPGLSLFDRIVIAAVPPPPPPPPPDPVPPEVRYDYYVPEKSVGGEDFGEPVYEVPDQLPPAPEATNDYYTPEKSVSDFGTPTYEPIDPNWQDPETVYDYFGIEVSGDWPTEPGDRGELPTIQPELRFAYYVPLKATPQ